MVLTVVLACYPLIIYLGLEHLPLNLVAGIILVLFTLRLLILNRARLAFLKHLSAPAACSGILLAGFSLLSNSDRVLLFYPALVNLFCLMVFAWSLIKPPSIIECFARLAQDALPEEAVSYTRKVTMVWCLFFIANGSLALFTAFYDHYALWTLYNGLVSYVLMGGLLGGEWLYRKWILKV